VSGGGAAGTDAAAAPPAAEAAAAASEGVAAGAVMVVAEATEGMMTMGGGRSCDGGRAMVLVFGLWAAGLAGGVSLCGVVWEERLCVRCLSMCERPTDRPNN